MIPDGIKRKIALATSVIVATRRMAGQDDETIRRESEQIAAETVAKMVVGTGNQEAYMEEINREVERALEQKPGPKPDPSKARDATTVVRSTQAWKEWVEGLAEDDRGATVSDLIDRALVAYARERKYPRPAPRR